MIPALCSGRTYNMVIVKLKLKPISETLQVLVRRDDDDGRLLY